MFFKIYIKEKNENRNIVSPVNFYYSKYKPFILIYIENKKYSVSF